MKLARLYEVDETAWLEESTRLIKQKRFGELDFKNLKDFLESAADRDKREVGWKLGGLLKNLLGWQIKAKRRTGLWKGEILMQRFELMDWLASKTLKDCILKNLQREYRIALKFVAMDTDWNMALFPSECSYSLDQILDEDFYPESALKKGHLAPMNGQRRKKTSTRFPLRAESKD